MSYEAPPAAPETARPWGTYAVLYAETVYEGIVAKRISVKPQSRLSLQSHEFRAEHWIVAQGTGVAVVGGDELPLGRNVHVFVPIGCKHRICNTSASDTLILIEVQVGSVLEEGDIVRYEDDYARAE
jgi:mannose-6-phosphate isomerase-like protein (cupin superfamily)